MAKFIAKATKDGGFDLGSDYNRARLKAHLKKNAGKKFRIEDLEVESLDQRGYFEGAVIRLWVYLDGNDHKDSVRVKQYHDFAKEEFNPEYVKIAGKMRKRGASTKGKLKGEHGIIEKVIMFLEEQYGIDRMEVLDPKKYKDWRDTIFPFGGPDNYIDYLVSIKKLT